MPFADYMPTVVFPDTRRGKAHWQGWEKTDVTIPYFCNLYSSGSDGRCARRDPSGVRRKNLCYRCVAGFIYDFQRAVEQNDDETRLKV